MADHVLARASQVCHSLAPRSPPPTNTPVHRSIGVLMIKRLPLAITINHHFNPFSLSRCPTPAVLVPPRPPQPPGHQMGTRLRVFLATNFHSIATTLTVFESAFESLHLNLPKTHSPPPPTLPSSPNLPSRCPFVPNCTLAVHTRSTRVPLGETLYLSPL